MEYLGDLGRLVGLRCASTEQSGHETRYITRRTLGGRRVAQILPGHTRTWEASWDLAEPTEASALAPFTTGAWGPGPWHWVPIQAQTGNLLTPRQADLLEVAASTYHGASGPMQTADGTWAPHSRWVSITSGFAPLITGIPVLPGHSITWTADVTGGAANALGMTFYDASGAAITGGGYGGTGTSTTTRVSMTRVVPATAVAVAVGVSAGTTRLTRPQVTWTDRMVPYSAGHGCRAAVIDGASTTLLAAWDIDHGAITSHSFTILEVG